MSLANVTKWLTPAELADVPLLTRSMMRGVGVEPRHGPRRALAADPKRVTELAGFRVRDNGLTLTHLRVLESVVLSAHAGAELLSGELLLAFHPGDALRAMGLKGGNRAWLRARLMELHSVFGMAPDAAGATSFEVLRVVDLSPVSQNKVFKNAVLAHSGDGQLVRGEVETQTWAVVLSAHYREWVAVQPSLRHAYLPRLRELKAAPEAVARFALTGACSRDLGDLLRELGVLEHGWNDAMDSAAYRAGRRAIRAVLDAAPALRELGVSVEKSANGYVVRSQNRPVGARFFAGVAAAQAPRASRMPRQPGAPRAAHGASASASSSPALRHLTSMLARERQAPPVASIPASTPSSPALRHLANALARKRQVA